MKRKKITVLIGLCLLLSSCVKQHTENQNNKPSEIKGVDIPNVETGKQIITTSNMPDLKLMEVFIKDLKQDMFQIEPTDLANRQGYKNCEDNSFILFDGDGIRTYYAKRLKPKPQNYYPDFHLVVYEFETGEQAKSAEKIINTALQSNGRYCNGKSPVIVTRNKREVFGLSTRAEMFRGYINIFGEKLKNYKLDQ